MSSRREQRQQSMSEPAIRTLDVPGAVLTYDVRQSERPRAAPTLLMIGSPMGAAGFGTLSGFFTDRTVVTYDPRGVERSRLVGDPDPATPITHAEDLHRVADALGDGPLDVFASSGGAVNALAWVAGHPDDVATLVAHEPPVAGVLPDAEVMIAAMQANHDLYLAKGWGAAMAYFIALTSHTGPLPADWLNRTTPDPATFGLPAEDDGSRDDPLFGVNMLTLPPFIPDFAAVAAAPTRLVIAMGEDSAGQMTARSAIAVAERLGTSAIVFPGGHGGFLGGEYGQTGQPDAFAAKLRDVLNRP
jgi:pimeloyl-ACP methyl ester carboxylesterase